MLYPLLRAGALCCILCWGLVPCCQMTAKMRWGSGGWAQALRGLSCASPLSPRACMCVHACAHTVSAHTHLHMYTHTHKLTCTHMCTHARACPLACPRWWPWPRANTTCWPSPPLGRYGASATTGTASWVTSALTRSLRPGSALWRNQL